MFLLNPKIIYFPMFFNYLNVKWNYNEKKQSSTSSKINTLQKKIIINRLFAIELMRI